MGLFGRKPNASLTAAARSELPEGTAPQYQTWQDEAWALYDNLGEYRQGVTWLGNVLGRARLIPAYAPASPGDEPEPIDDDDHDPATDLVQSIAHGIGGQAELLRSATVHLTVPGEGWFIGQVANDLTNEISWKFYSADEIRKSRTAGKDVWQIRTGSQDWKDLPNDALPVRVWRPHDRRHWEADSSSRAALPIMRRLELLNRRVDAQTQSRLASNGVYWVPSEIDFPANPDFPESDDPFTDEFIQSQTIAIKTPGSAMAAIPSVARAPGDRIEQIVWHQFHGDNDSELQAKREMEIRRLATAMDVPPEVLLGMVGVNHWGAWQIEESALKTTVTSLLELICWSLTTGYLTPALMAVRDNISPLSEGKPLEDERRRIVWYDLSELAVRPDKTQPALELDARMTIKTSATLRETGFDIADYLDPKVVENQPELRYRIGLEFIKNPATAEAGLELLGINLTSKINAGGDGATPSAPPSADSGGSTQGAPPATRDAAPTPPPAAAPRPARGGDTVISVPSTNGA